MTDVSAAPANRKTRSATALKQITNLQIRRTVPGGPARGSFDSTRPAPRSPPTQRDGSGSVPANATPGGNARFARGPANLAGTRGDATPAGQMVRAPSQLRITRSPVGGANTRGPNLRGPDLRGREGMRARGPGGPRGGPNSGGGDRGPKKRERKQGGDAAPRPTALADIDPATTLSDGMVHHLLRLQRKEWDRVPYEPKYAKGSFAANELIYAGREFFKGESPPVKIWGPLEKRIGVVGMFGAEATLQVRRVGDGDSEPFGQEADDAIETTGAEAQKASAVQ